MAFVTTHGISMDSYDEQFFKALGARIASARKARHLTQQQLADQLGLAQQTLAHYEVGRRCFPASMLPRLAEKLELTVDDLLGSPGKARSKPGPASRLELQIERLRQLPKAKQQLLVAMLDAAILQAGH